jgi:uncharacterized repeat protein (TIGR01451 family)
MLSTRVNCDKEGPMQIKRLFLSLIVGLGLIPVLVGLLVAVGAGIGVPGVAHAVGFRYVAPAGSDDGNDCRTRDKPCASVQHAVDVAAPGDEIRVAAGTYTDLHNIIVSGKTVTQVVYISRPVVIRGGYSRDFSTWDPSSYFTVLDAGSRGRVIFITGDISATVEWLHIKGGEAAGMTIAHPYDAGGGVCVISAAATIRNNRVFSNSATDGGGLFLHSSTAAIISGNTVISNSARRAGGGLFMVLSAPTLNSNVIGDNEAISNGGGLFLLSSMAGLSGNTIFTNTAEQGGGLFMRLSTATLDGNAIVSNTADTFGGGLRLAEHSVATLNGDRLVANRAITGGGVLLAGSCTATFTNTLIADNWLSANTGRGAGLLVADSSARLLHASIARNRGGDGSGVYVTVQPGKTRYSTVALTNSILVSHTVDISVTGGNTVTVNGVLGAPLTISRAATAAVTVCNAHVGDPAFVNPDAGDYHIGPTSAARDAGEAEGGIPLDWEGEVRPVGRGYDLGFDEFLAVLSLAKQASPDPVEAGELLTYTVRITNPSHIGLHATLTDTLPVDVTPSRVLIWRPVTIAAGGAWTAEVGVRVNQGARGVLTNVVEAVSDEGAAGVYTETSFALRSSLAVTKEASPRVANVGETIRYNYRLANVGDVSLNGLSVGDSLLGVISPATTVLAPGQANTGTVAYVVRQGDLPGPLVNIMTVTGTSPMGNPVTATDTTSVTLTSHPAIRVAKDANPSAARVGETITYLYAITNTGDVTLTDIAAGDDRLGSIRLGADSLLPAEVATGSATYTLVKGDRPGPIINTVTVTGTSPTGLVTASVSESVKVIPRPCWSAAGAVLAVVLISYGLKRG